MCILKTFLRLAYEMFPGCHLRYKYRVLQTIQNELILLCGWAEWAVLCSVKTALKSEYEIWNRLTHIQFNVWGRV